MFNALVLKKIHELGSIILLLQNLLQHCNWNVTSPLFLDKAKVYQISSTILQS